MARLLAANPDATTLQLKPCGRYCPWKMMWNVTFSSNLRSILASTPNGKSDSSFGVMMNVCGATALRLRPLYSSCVMTYRSLRLSMFWLICP